jgi:hypothetical protein
MVSGIFFGIGKGYLVRLDVDMLQLADANDLRRVVLDYLELIFIVACAISACELHVSNSERRTHGEIYSCALRRWRLLAVSVQVESTSVCKGRV